MKLLRSFPAMSFALVMLAIAGLCVAQKSVPLLLVAGTLAALSWYITEGPRGRTLPRWVANLLVIAASLSVFVDLVQNRHDVMGVLGRFAIWLTLIKLYERRTARDHAHLLTLSMLLMMTGCLQSTDLFFGVIMLAYIALGLYVLLLYQLYAAYEQSRDERQRTIAEGYRLVPPLRPIIGRNAGAQFKLLTMCIGIAGLAFSVLMFVGFPRDVGVDMFGSMRSPLPNRITQFSWDVDLIAGGQISESRAKVLSLTVRDASGQPIRWPEPLRLRGTVLDRYDGRGRWSRGQGMPIELSASPASTVSLQTDATADNAPYTLDIALARAHNGVTPVFTIPAPVSVLFDSRVDLQYDPARQTIQTTDAARRVLSYRVGVNAEPSDALLEDLTRGRTHFRSMRSGWSRESRARFRAIAESILAQEGVPIERPRLDERWTWNQSVAEAFTRYLHSNLFQYTTDLSTVTYRGPETDPALHFLEEGRRGHCEYFASALTLLCRSVGVPARLVAGYLAYDYDETTQQYVVLESNAHAWVEVATGPHRWTTFDPTPAAILQATHQTPTTFADRVRWAYERVESDWSSTFIAFDGTSQAQLAETINRGWTTRLTAMLQDVREWMARINAAFYLGPAGYIWMGIVAFALLIAIVALIKLMRRSMAIRHTLQLQHVRGAEYQRMLRQLGFYLDMLQVLQQAGLAKPDWQPPMQYAAALSHSHPQEAALVSRITELFYLARYGHQPLTRQQQLRSRKLVEQLASQLHVKV